MKFEDRHDAGKKLAPLLNKYKGLNNCIVIGLPRGGVITAYEIAKELKLPLDIICPRKVGSPYNPELAVGAICESGIGYFNQDVIRSLEVSKEYIQAEVKKEKEVSRARRVLYRKNRKPLNLKGKSVIIVDDGLATGATMKAAIQWVKEEGVKKVIVAVPVSPPDTFREVSEMVDEIFCLATPPFFSAVGQFYENFGQTTDEEVIEIMEQYEK